MNGLNHPTSLLSRSPKKVSDTMSAAQLLTKKMLFIQML